MYCPCTINFIKLNVFWAEHGNHEHVRDDGPLIAQYEVGDSLEHCPLIISSDIVDIAHELVCKGHAAIMCI